MNFPVPSRNYLDDIKVFVGNYIDKFTRFWNDHNQGKLAFDNLLITAATVTSATITTLISTTATITNAVITAITGLTSLNSTFIGLGRNRIINGDMLIDQRNEGALLTVNTTGTEVFGCDRWFAAGTTAAGVFKTQQVATTPPTGFGFYTHITVTTADATPAAGSAYIFEQVIEGNNVRDFLYGSSSAITSTLSFWVRSNLTGTFSGSFRNNGSTRSYPFSYSISVTNTWEKKSVTITGDLTGTWTVGVTVGIQVAFDLGTGSTFQGTAGAWVATNIVAVTGANKIITNTANTFDLTGVQLEPGSVASAFEYVPTPYLIAKCFRFYWKTFPAGTVPIQNSGVQNGALFYQAQVAGVGGAHGITVKYPVQMKSTPTVTTYNPNAANAKWRNASANTDSGAATVLVATESGFGISNPQVVGDLATSAMLIHTTSDCEF